MAARTAPLLAALWCAAAALPGGAAPPSALPGSPPSEVVASVGSTPQLSARVDPVAARFRPDPAQAALGGRLFRDPRLSEPRGTSCASCHDPRRAFSPSLSDASLAGPRTPQGSRPGRFSVRNAPSLLYVRYVPRRHFYMDDEAEAPAPYGGLFADGRADTLAEQVRGPLFDPNEMNNRSPAALLRKVRKTELGNDIARVFGDAALSDGDRLVQAMGGAIEAYLQSDEMAPFTSRFDQWQQGQGELGVRELRGLALFKDPQKGNCVACHAMNDTARRPERSLFTDFGYEALGVPRNRSLARPGHFDVGLEATARRLGWPDPEQWCGYFRTPTLRNVAVRQSFMHNASIQSLRDAVRFYATRSTEPEAWFGGAKQSDDVPARCRSNINVSTMPLNRREGAPPALSDSDIDDLVAFLKTLNDRFIAPSRPSS
jgi:cytochrome c peroxidase